MRHYLFEIVTEFSDLEGEQFLVGAYSENEALLIAEREFDGEELEYLGEVSEFEAESCGLDEY